MVSLRNHLSFLPLKQAIHAGASDAGFACFTLQDKLQEPKNGQRRSVSLGIKAFVAGGYFCNRLVPACGTLQQLWAQVLAAGSPVETD